MSLSYKFYLTLFCYPFIHFLPAFFLICFVRFYLIQISLHLFQILHIIEIFFIRLEMNPPCLLFGHISAMIKFY